MLTHKLRRALGISLFLLLFFSAGVAAQDGESADGGADLQDLYIDTLIENQIQVVISLVNFAEVEGVILAQDNAVVLLRNWRIRQRLVYKSAIAVITPIPAATNVLSDF
jgi:RNA chaperone Hfq